LKKHGLDFADANEVLQSSYRWDIDIIRSGEMRIQLFIPIEKMQHELVVFAWQVKKNERLIMSGLKKNAMSRSEILTAMRSMPTTEDFIWNGIDEDDRPATDEELERGRGRPAGSTKTQIALRVDNHVLNAFKSTGKGWQTRINDALKQWLIEHPTEIS
jgi:uncharacterized protein (DUF4415 family)